MHKSVISGCVSIRVESIRLLQFSQRIYFFFLLSAPENVKCHLGWVKGFCLAGFFSPESGQVWGCQFDRLKQSAEGVFSLHVWALNFKEATEAMASVALVLALVPLQTFSKEFKIFQLKCPFQNANSLALSKMKLQAGMCMVVLQPSSISYVLQMCEIWQTLTESWKWMVGSDVCPATGKILQLA